MSKPWQENPIPDTPESSNPKSNKYCFYMELKPLHKFKLALEALADPTFNEHGVGIVDISEYSFCISVCNADKAFARLWINPLGVIRYSCFNPIIAKLVRLGPIVQRFPADLNNDNDRVQVYHICGSNELCFNTFKFGTAVAHNRFSAEFVEIDTPTLKGLSIDPYCEITVPTEDLREMIAYLLRADDARLVSVGILENSATFEIGSKRSWKYNSEKIEALVPLDFQREWFNWTYDTFMKKASFLGHEFGVRVQITQEGNIMFRFKIQGLGDLTIIKQNILMTPDINLRTAEKRKRSDEKTDEDGEKTSSD